MTCPNCNRNIKAIESVNGVTAEVSVNFCPGCGAMMPGTNYEQVNISCLSQVQSHAAAAGLSWQEWIEAAKNAIIIVENQYDSVANAMDEHRELFSESEE